MEIELKKTKTTRTLCVLRNELSCELKSKRELDGEDQQQPWDRMEQITFNEFNTVVTLCHTKRMTYVQQQDSETLKQRKKKKIIKSYAMNVFIYASKGITCMFGVKINLKRLFLRS